MALLRVVRAATCRSAAEQPHDGWKPHVQTACARPRGVDARLVPTPAAHVIFSTIARVFTAVDRHAAMLVASYIDCTIEIK